MSNSTESQIKTVIRECLSRAGMESLPPRDEQPLREYGLDSLTIVLTVSELEQALAIQLPASEITERWFESISALEARLKPFIP